jgi:hypothetical protein
MVCPESAKDKDGVKVGTLVQVMYTEMYNSFKKRGHI